MIEDLLTIAVAVAKVQNVAAEDLDLQLLAATVNTISSYLATPPTLNQLAALSAIAMDVGLDTISASLLVRHTSHGNLNAALWEFTRWADRGAGPDRRTAEATLFAKP